MGADQKSCVQYFLLQTNYLRRIGFFGCERAAIITKVVSDIPADVKLIYINLKNIRPARP